MTFRERIKKLRQQAQAAAGNLGSLGEAKQGFDRGFAPASEDARSVLYKYRESLGLDEPPQAAEVASRSGLLAALRDGLTAQGVPDPIGFSDDMLRARLEAGQTILDNPSLFQEEIERRKLSKRELMLDAQLGKGSLEDFGPAADFSNVTREEALKQIQLTEDQEKKIVRAAVEDIAKDVKRQMREQSILKKLGYNVGAIVGDINEDRSRSLYWLLNAPQALSSTLHDTVMSAASPNLRTMRSISRKDLKRATDAGLLRKIGDEPLSDQQLATLMSRDEQYQALDPAQSAWLNLDNFEPAVPGIRRKYDPKIENILRYKQQGDGYVPDLGDTVFGQRRISPSTLNAMGLGATALATNAGLGLMGTEETGVPFITRREGYAAASPEENDPRKSGNAFFEAGTRYVLSRDGKLLPKADFLLERPDVTSKEYSKYQAYLFDKELDFNPLDGKFNFGIVKGTDEGIHGAEWNILGQTLSRNEAGLPLAGALGGLVVGAALPNIRQIRLQNQRSTWVPGKGRRGMIKNILGYLPEVRAKRYDKDLDTNPNNPLLKVPVIDKATQALEDYFTETNKVTGKRDMNANRVTQALAAGSFGGLAAGTAIGLQAEDQRRRDNFADNNPGIDYDIYKRNSKALLDERYRRQATDPNREAKRDKSKAGYARETDKENLMRYMQRQQSAVDQVADAWIRSKMQDGIDKQQWAVNKMNQIDEEIAKRKSGTGNQELVYPLTSVEPNPQVIDPSQGYY